MKLKRIIALSGVGLLVLLYIVTLISAIFASKAAPGLFKACFISTFAVPVLLYAFLLVYKLSKDRADLSKMQLEEALASISEEAEDESEDESEKESEDSSKEAPDETSDTEITL